MSSDRDAIDLDLLAASLRADAAEEGAFVESLAAKLEEALPGRVRVHRWRERLLGPKRVGKVTFDAGDRRLELRYRAGVLQTTRSKLSGGIVLNTEELDMEEWLDALGGALAVEARRSGATRRALERLLTDPVRRVDGIPEA